MIFSVGFMADCYALALRLRQRFNVYGQVYENRRSGRRYRGLTARLTAPLACIPRRERQHARGSPPAAPLLHPCGDRLPAGPGRPGIAAQLRGLAADLGGAFENPSNLGQQESAPGGEIAQRSHRGIVLGSREFSPPHMMQRLAVQLRYDGTVSSRDAIDHRFEYRGMSSRLTARGRTFAMALVMSSRPA